MFGKKFILLCVLSGEVLTWAALPRNAILQGQDLVTKKSVAVPLSSADKGVVVVFLSARCPCSQGHERALMELYQQYNNKGFSFIGVHANGNESAIVTEAHFRESRVSFPIIPDDKAQLANALGALKTPHVFILSREAQILYAGGVDDSRSGVNPKRLYLADALKALSEGREPPEKETKTMGCAIERP